MPSPGNSSLSGLLSAGAMRDFCAANPDVFHYEVEEAGQIANDFPGKAGSYALPGHGQSIYEDGLGTRPALALTLHSPVMVFFQQQQALQGGCLQNARKRSGTGADFHDLVAGLHLQKAHNFF